MIVRNDLGRVPSEPGYSAEPEPSSTASLGPSGEYPSRARAFALRAHGGQRYGDQPYHVHLAAVVQILRDFGFFGPYEEAAWLHDVVEDTSVTISEIEREFGDEVADLVFACTGYGFTRAARNRSIYRRIARYPKGAVVKVADRIANVEASKPYSTHRAIYAREGADFRRAVEAHVPAIMMERLERAYRDSDRNPKGGDSEAAPSRSDESAGPQGHRP